MGRNIKIALSVVVLSVVGLLCAGEAYFYFAVLKPMVQKMVKDATNGNPEAQTALGMAYDRPSKFFPAIVPDRSKAIFWYQKAADQGAGSAELMLSFAYADGKGVRQDMAEGVRLLRRAAEHGIAEGQWMLGQMLASGSQEVARDEFEAAKWYRMAAEQGNADGQRLLGRCYATGRGVQQDDTQAAAWYQKAAAQGDAQAREALRQTPRHSGGLAR